MANKRNEITAVPILLARAGEPDVVITMDALLTPHSVAEQIGAQRMHDLMVAKANQPRLLAECSADQ